MDMNTVWIPKPIYTVDQQQQSIILPKHYDKCLSLLQST